MMYLKSKNKQNCFGVQQCSSKYIFFVLNKYTTFISNS